MKRLKAFVIAGALALSAVYFNYYTDMQAGLEVLAKERLSRLNYQTMSDGFIMNEDKEEFKEKLQGKTLDNYIISQCKLTNNIKLYVQENNRNAQSYYDSVRDVDAQISATIDDLCAFLNEHVEVNDVYISGGDIPAESVDLNTELKNLEKQSNQGSQQKAPQQKN